jgi:hypothetical protein
MEKKVFGTAGLDETKPLVRQLLDRAFGHLNISRRTHGGPPTGIRMPISRRPVVGGIVPVNRLQR